jgi:hypothetical protein
MAADEVSPSPSESDPASGDSSAFLLLVAWVGLTDGEGIGVLPGDAWRGIGEGEAFGIISAEGEGEGGGEREGGGTGGDGEGDGGGGGGALLRRTRRNQSNRYGPCKAGAGRRTGAIAGGSCGGPVAGIPEEEDDDWPGRGGEFRFGLRPPRLNPLPLPLSGGPLRSSSRSLLPAPGWLAAAMPGPVGGGFGSSLSFSQEKS